MALSLSKVALHNGARIAAAADAAVAADATGRLEAFRGFAASAAMSSNASADKVELYDEAGALLDARTAAQHRVGGDRRAGLREFRRAQGSWYLRRVRFEGLWTHGRRFVYGALNAGGTGLDAFGEFCIVIADPSRAAPDALGLFAANSAERYCSVDGEPDRDRALAEAAPWPQRAELAVAERAASAIAADPDRWASVLCEANRFIEVVVAPGPSLSAITEVRLRADYLTRLHELEANVLSGAALPATERREAGAFAALNRWRRAHGVAIHGVG